eukprot:1161568-Pelagomonas_calceolata.AAC.3
MVSGDLISLCRLMASDYGTAPCLGQDNVETASVRVLGGLDNVAGVKIPQFETQVIPGDSKMDLAGARLWVCGSVGVGVCAHVCVIPCEYWFEQSDTTLRLPAAVCVLSFARLEFAPCTFLLTGQARH